jgi:hypothetical protein
MALISLLEITEIRKFRTTNGSVFLFWSCIYNHIWHTKALALHLLHRKPPRISLLEIDHGWDWTYLYVPQSRYCDLFNSHAETTHSHPVMEKLNYLPLKWYLFFISKCFYFIMLCLTHRYIVSIHKKKITMLNRCEYIFSANKLI